MLAPKVNASGREGLDENFAGASLEFNSRDAARARARALFADTGRKIRLPDRRETG